ncbi:MAG: phosphoribosyl-AMP cyclohydrolase [Candidatus Bathyarchaeia archaeon]
MRISRSEAERIIQEVNFEKMGGLVPVVVQEHFTDTVLMLAFMNREALTLTLETGLMHYWSRTKGRVWLKGEKSKHYSLLQNAVLDCDKDAILFRVNQVGPCCHTGRYSCFHNPILPIEEKGVDARVLDKAFNLIKREVGTQTEDVVKRFSEEAEQVVNFARKGDSEGLIEASTKHLLSILRLLVEAGIPITRVYEKLVALNSMRTGL